MAIARRQRVRTRFSSLPLSTSQTVSSWWPPTTSFLLSGVKARALMATGYGYAAYGAGRGGGLGGGGLGGGAARGAEEQQARQGQADDGAQDAQAGTRTQHGWRTPGCGGAVGPGSGSHGGGSDRWVEGDYSAPAG